VGPELISYNEYVKLFSRGTRTKIKKIDLEKAYHDSIINLNSDFAIDDLNLLIGDFKGDYKKLHKISEIKFNSTREILKSGRLL